MAAFLSKTIANNIKIYVDNDMLSQYDECINYAYIPKNPSEKKRSGKMSTSERLAILEKEDSFICRRIAKIATVPSRTKEMEEMFDRLFEEHCMIVVKHENLFNMKIDERQEVK